MKCKITNRPIENLGEPGDEVEVDEAVYLSFKDNLEVLDADDDESTERAAETAASVEETVDGHDADADNDEADASVERSETAASAPETIDAGETDPSPNMADSENGEAVDVSEMSVSELKEFLNEHEGDLSDDDLDAMYAAEEDGEDRETAKKAIDGKRS